jgi:hypothetical protein
MSPQQCGSINAPHFFVNFSLEIKELLLIHIALRFLKTHPKRSEFDGAYTDDTVGVVVALLLAEAIHVEATAPAHRTKL